MSRHPRRGPALALALVLLCARLAPAARLHGHVLDDATGEVLIGASLKVLPTAGTEGLRVPQRGAASNLDGYFVIASLPPGAWGVEVSYQGYQTARLLYKVAEGADTLREIRLRPSTLQMQALTVTAEKTEQDLQKEEVYAGKVRMDRKQMDLAPVLIQRDLLRSLLTVPGVLPSNDFSSDLNVRGSSADENLILLDGVEVYNPNHLGGLFSAFIPGAVKHTDMMRSSWPAQYGGRLGAVLQVSSREGNQEHLDGEVGLGALASSIQVSGPTWKLDNSSWMVALRRSYIDLATKAFTKNEVPYHFMDAQARANWDLGEKDRLSVTGYWGDDVLDTGALDFTFGNRAVNLNWRHVWNAHWYSRAILAFSRFRTDFDFGGQDKIILQTNHINDWSSRAQLEYHHSDALVVETGLTLKSVVTNFQSWYYREHMWDIDVPMSEVAVYAQASWRPHPLLIIEPGLRLASFRAGGLLEQDVYAVQRLEPRLGVKLSWSENLRFKAAWGLYNQGIHQFRRDGSTFNFLWVAMDSTSAPARASHFTGGVEANLPEDFVVELEGYYKKLDHLVEGKALMEEHYADDPSDNAYLFHFGKGEAFGGDLSVKRTRGLWTGQLGYSMSWAVREVDSLNAGRPFYAAFDKRHNMNLLVNRGFHHRVKKGWPLRKWVRLFRYDESAAGLSWIWASGPRFTAPYSSTWLGGEGLNGQESVFHNYGGRNAQQLRPYNRLDLSWTFTHHKKASAFECRMGVLNLLNSPNYWGVSFDYTEDPGGLPVKQLTEGIRRLPSLELTWRF